MFLSSGGELLETIGGVEFTVSTDWVPLNSPGGLPSPELASSVTARIAASWNVNVAGGLTIVAVASKYSPVLASQI